MIYYLAQCLEQYCSIFHVFTYITVRALFCALTALMISLLFGKPVIRRLNAYRIGQMVRDDGPQSHLQKTGTPTMGGLLILISITFSIFLWGRLDNFYTDILLAVLLMFGLIGGIDDYRKLVLKSSDGMPAKWKYFLQSLLAVGALFVLYHQASAPAQTQLLIPFLKNFSINLGIFYFVLGYFVIVGSSNAVNLTDGLDGLAIMPIVLVAGGFAIFAYVSGHVGFSKYLYVPYIPGVGEVVVFCSAIVGAGLGFLWFNAYPAEVFMGDVGSLSLGAALGTIAIMVRQEVVLAIMGGIFVFEALSVILQVGYFKASGGKRIFKMSPVHHHFELKGWHENKVVVRFWIITFVLVVLGLMTLKFR